MRFSEFNARLEAALEAVQACARCWSVSDRLYAQLSLDSPAATKKSDGSLALGVHWKPHDNLMNWPTAGDMTAEELRTIAKFKEGVARWLKNAELVDAYFDDAPATPFNIGHALEERKIPC